MSEVTPPPPRANPDLLGHREAEIALRHAWERDRLAHGWLVTGPAGIGKATLAFRFARFVLAGGEGALASGAGLGIDPDHPVFRRVASGGHLDLITIERAVNENTGRLRGEIVVEQVRALRERLGRTAAEGGWRAVIIDPADEMNLNAQNALLKVLEEPPARTVLMLVCHRPGRLLPTVRSRCRQLPLRPLADADVNTLLARYASLDHVAGRTEVVRLAGGSAGRALTLAASGGAAVLAEIDDVLSGLAEADPAALFGLADRVGKSGAEGLFRLAADHLTDRLAERIRIAAGAARSAETATGATASPPHGRVGLDRWLELWDKSRGLLARTESANLDRRQVFLTLLLELREAVRRYRDPAVRTPA